MRTTIDIDAHLLKRLGFPAQTYDLGKALRSASALEDEEIARKLVACK